MTSTSSNSKILGLCRLLLRPEGFQFESGKGVRDINSSISSRMAIVIALPLFFISGFAALLYQVIWHRMLALFSGVDVYSVTVIVAAFMGGLGCGSLTGGHIADRLHTRDLMRLFALCELAIALFAVGSKWLYYDLLYLELNHLAKSPTILTGVLFFSLLWPTFFMGMSLPLLSKALTRNVNAAARTVGGLYGINTIGAALGAFISGWWLGRLLGLETTIQIGAGLNALCAVGAILLSWGLSSPGSPQTRESLPPPFFPKNENAVGPTSMRRPFSFRTWILIYGLSGFIALSLEIVWFRLIAVMAKTVAFTFANLLTLYLLGLATGTFIGIWLVGKSPRPARAFFLMQWAITLYAGLSIIVFTHLLGISPWLDGLWAYFNTDDTSGFGPALYAVVNHAFDIGRLSPAIQDFAFNLFALYFLIPMALIGPPTLLMGMSFPFLQKVVQTDTSLLGRRVGWLQAANILGCTVGTVFTSWVFLRFLGTPGTFKLILVMGAVFFFLGLRARPFSRSSLKFASYLTGIGLIGALAVLTPDASFFWAKLHGTGPDKIIIGEDGSGLCALKIENPGSDRTTVHLDGVMHSALPYGGIHTLLGALPALLHPNPKEIAVVGLGSGDTAFSIGSRRETEEITCFEIVVPQITTLRILDQRKEYRGLRSFLGDSRVRLKLTDGRAAIMQEDKKYDIIETDALFPYSAFAGNLYSLEYFLLLKNRLKPGGIAVTWAPTLRTFRTFAKVFPFVLMVSAGPILVGSNEPIVFDIGKINDRLESPFTRSYYAEAGIDPEDLRRRLNEAKVSLLNPGHDRSSLDDLNTDLYPKDEYLLP